MRHVLAFTVLLIAGLAARADDWPAWRGPTGQGYCFEKNVPLTWSDKENVKWKVKLEHPGNSTPIVWKDKVFLTMANKGGTVRSILCFDRTNGNQLWKNDINYQDKEQNWTPDWYCNASPTTDGKLLVVSFGSAGMYCYDLAGKELWKRTDLGHWQHSFGNGASPVLYGDLAILWCGPNSTIKDAAGKKVGKANRNFLLAVNKTTGKTVWEQDEKHGSWGTPIIVKIDNQDQLLLGTGTDAKNIDDPPDNFLKGYDPKTGKELWKAHGVNSFCYTSPLFANGVAIQMCGYGGSAMAVKVGGAGDLTKERLWLHAKNNQRVGSGIIVGEHCYVIDDNGTPHCYELTTGKDTWKVDKRPVGTNWGSMVHADGKLYCLTRDGSTIVLKASPSYEILAINRLGQGESTNSSPAISNGEIFLRTNRTLWCISEKK